MAKGGDQMVPVSVTRLEYLLKCEEVVEAIRLHLRPKEPRKPKSKKEKKK